MTRETTLITDRRTFLGSLGASATLACLPRQATARTRATASPPRLVVVLLRGAADGLNIVVPHTQASYYRLRPRIAIARPGSPGGALELDGRFGLHPALAPLLPYWQQGRLAFVHAAGSPDPSRSHFDAQDNMATGTPGVHRTASGWLNRLGGALPDRSDGQYPTVRLISIGPTLPRIAFGPHPVTTIPHGQAAARPGALDRARLGRLFDSIYASDPKLGPILESYTRERGAVRASIAAADEHARAASAGMPRNATFAGDAVRLAALMRRDPRVLMGFIPVSGWDTHAAQAGQLATALSRLGHGLDAMARELGPVFDDTIVVVMSEFGRSVAENGSLGTDHGHGNVMWLLGGRVAGGRVHADWPGLDEEQLFERRDLAVTTDFRAVLAQVCQRHMGVSDSGLADVFPGLAHEADSFRLTRV
ncbi:MAG: DUF1501 domain-containing protein [Burkholderiaceae bacterium]|nr:DUF1501 domain-containing protein [Burkholderiaceae bacterium]